MPYIKKICTYLPEHIVTNEELVKEFPEWSVDKIAQKVGVNQRHVASEKETAADLAYKAAEKMFLDPEIKKEDVDFLILCTQSPDYFLPTTACVLQHRIGLRTNIGALDYNLGCSGFIYGLALSKGLIMSGIARNVLLLTAETYSKYLHVRDKGNRTIFGDAAAAILISESGLASIGNFSLGTDGSGAENLIIKTGGRRNPLPASDLSFDENGNPVSSDYLYMDGSEIFSFTQRNVPIVVSDTLLKNNLSKEDIDLFVFHQANKFMLNFLRKKIKIEDSKFYYYMSEVGNTVSCSIPLALESAMNDGSIKMGDKVLLSGFGVGYSWGGNVLYY